MGAGATGTRRFPDLGALLTAALARPLAGFNGTTPAKVKRYVAPGPATIQAVGVSASTRCVAWLLAAGIWLGLGAVAMTIENIATGPPATVTSTFVWPPLALLLIVAVLSGLKAGAAWYLSDERWSAAGRALRWTVTPGNRDVVIALVAIGLGVLVGRA